MTIAKKSTRAPAHAPSRAPKKKAAAKSAVSFASLSEMPADADVPLLDRREVAQESLTPQQKQWREEGVVRLEKFLPDDLMDAYIDVRKKHPEAGGWQCPTPYMHVPELRALACYKPLANVLASLVGEPMGVHLNLTGWITTEREWHQDDYLNPGFINSWYAAVWMALDDIHPDSGPFQYIPGSHRWPVMRQEKVKALLAPHEAADITWCAIAERFVTPTYETEIARTKRPTESFVAKRGDVLIWHGRLVHRGSRANVKHMPRKALISHYSAVSKRRDMPDVAHTDDGVPYFLLHWPLDFDPARPVAEQVTAKAPEPTSEPLREQAPASKPEPRRLSRLVRGLKRIKQALRPSL